MVHVSTPTMERHTGGFYWLMDAGKSPERVDLWLSDLASYLRKESRRDDFARLTAVDNYKFFEFGRPATDEYPSSPTICVARRGKQIVVTGDRPELMVSYLSAPPDKRMADDASFQEAHAVLGDKKGNLYLYIDGNQLLNESNLAKHPVEMRRLGMDRLRWVGLTLEGAGDSLRHRLEIRADVESGLPTFFTSKEQFDLAQCVPEQTVAFAQIALDGEKLYSAIRNYGVQFMPGRAAEFDENMAQLRQQFGADVQEICSLLGNEAAFAITPPDSGGLIPDVYFIAKAKDAKSAVRGKTIFETILQRQEAKMRLSHTKYQGYNISYAQMKGDVNPIVPALTVDGELLVVGSNVTAVKHYIEFRKAGSATLAGKKSYQSSMQSVAGGPASGYLWFDWPSAVGFAYANFANIAPYLLLGPRTSVRRVPAPGQPPVPDKDQDARELDEVEAMLKETFQFDWSKMPHVETVLQYIPPQIIRFNIGNRGVSLDSRAFF
jgi:hypothetical protein